MELFFVYNANSSTFSQIKDLIHKSVWSKTYPCRLCSLTFGAFSQKAEWRRFISSLPLKTKFLHKDEFLKLFPRLIPNEFPSVFLNRGKQPELVISKSEIDSQETLADLKELVQQKVTPITEGS